MLLANIANFAWHANKVAFACHAITYASCRKFLQEELPQLGKLTKMAGELGPAANVQLAL
jgi:hypothetical protein